jgi:hypothetical protein
VRETHCEADTTPYVRDLEHYRAVAQFRADDPHQPAWENDAGAVVAELRDVPKKLMRIIDDGEDAAKDVKALGIDFREFL